MAAPLSTASVGFPLPSATVMQTVDLAAAVKLNNFHCGGGTSHATAPRDSSSGVYSLQRRSDQRYMAATATLSPVSMWMVSAVPKVPPREAQACGLLAGVFGMVRKVLHSREYIWPFWRKRRR
ncbi:hypothetical protein EI94DRAFT_350123 [Lactarius quietus]|nr:hypothetical protein EI94DRAFT_350123 [Lactarius quietus]